MSPTTIAAIAGIVSIVLSWGGSAFIAGYRWGNVKTRLDGLEKDVDTRASKEQLAGIKEDVAEIKGMFRITLKDLNARTTTSQPTSCTRKVFSLRR